MTSHKVPFVVRGELVEGADVVHSGPGFTFTTPDPAAVTARIGCQPLDLADLHDVSLDEVLDLLAGLGERLQLDRNPFIQEAFELSVLTSDLPERVLRTIYEEQLRLFFRRDILADAVGRRAGRAVLEGWAGERGPDGRSVRVRAYGARVAHVIAGNTPGVAGITIARNALTRGDAIIKTPRNDPLTAVAIARTLIDMAPGHPVTRHVSALYWRGGDTSVEAKVFSAATIDKIVAWGGAPAIENAARYVGPGVELIALDPKRSLSFLGPQALAPGEQQRDAARMLARDTGMFNQAGCVSARVAYVQSDGQPGAAGRLTDFARLVYAELQELPAGYSAPVTALPAGLSDRLDMAQLLDDPLIIGGGTVNGGVIVSADGTPVDWAEHLSARYVNLVLVDDFTPAVSQITSVVQTVGVWPDTLRHAMRHTLALAGAQRIVTLGGATNPYGNQAIPQDGIEVLRRMCRWIVDEQYPADLSAAG